MVAGHRGRGRARSPASWASAWCPYSPLGRRCPHRRLPHASATSPRPAGATRGSSPRRSRPTAPWWRSSRTSRADRGVTPGQVALAWVHARGDDVVPIPGTKRRATWTRTSAPSALALEARRAGPARRPGRPRRRRPGAATPRPWAARRPLPAAHPLSAGADPAPGPPGAGGGWRRRLRPYLAPAPATVRRVPGPVRGRPGPAGPAAARAEGGRRRRRRRRPAGPLGPWLAVLVGLGRRRLRAATTPAGRSVAGSSLDVQNDLRVAIHAPPASTSTPPATTPWSPATS